jgi:serine/threonine-protein kinase RsbT
MAGNYRSKLGMGRGLRGVKQLSDRFDITTEVGKGTTVTFFLKVV